MMPVYIPSAASASGLLRYALIDTVGTEHDLTPATSPTLFVSKGSRGFGSPPVDLVLEKLPYAPGSLLRYSRTQPVEVSLPLIARATTMSGLLTAVDAVRGWFATGDESGSSPIYLKITRPDDDVRLLPCYYAGGLEGDLSVGSPTWCPLVVSLIAPDPAWIAEEPTELAYGSADVMSGGVPITLPVMNPGDFDAYPIWTITGPASNIRIANATTGKSFEFSGGGGLTIPSGDTLAVDTRPASQRRTLPILSGDGISYYDRVGPQSSLWWLRPNSNNLTIRATGMSGATAFGLSFTPRYRGALR